MEFLKRSYLLDQPNGKANHFNSTAIYGIWSLTRDVFRFFRLLQQSEQSRRFVNENAVQVITSTTLKTFRELGVQFITDTPEVEEKLTLLRERYRNFIREQGVKEENCHNCDTPLDCGFNPSGKMKAE